LFTTISGGSASDDDLETPIHEACHGAAAWAGEEVENARLSVAITTPTVGMVVFIFYDVFIFLLFSINVLYIGFKLTRGAAPLTTLIAA
jgi:hypothetical protein